MQCPCGSSQNFENCCEPYLTQKEFAPTPEALMRSRYSAHVLKNVEYLRDTMSEEMAQHYPMQQVRDWLNSVTWQELIVFDTKFKTPSLGYVSFDATYLENGMLSHICEKSTFHKINEKWLYVGGKSMNPAGRKKTNH